MSTSAKTSKTPKIPLMALHQAWRQRPARERRLLLSLAMLLGLLALWQGAIAPAWTTWRLAPVRQAEIEAQTRQMLQWQAEAKQLQAPARLARNAAMGLLQEGAERLLGPGVQLQPQGELLQVTLKAAPAEGLAQWLSLARDKAQAMPQQAQLQRQPAVGTAKNPSTDPIWQGSLLMRLP